MVRTALEAARVSTEVLDWCTLLPFDEEAILSAVARNLPAC